ncbi:MAG: hypothetical protein K0B52_05375, partial [FCB group bacterium]|nr:hypothetical protein [FCB group bacterium]
MRYRGIILLVFFAIFSAGCFSGGQELLDKNNPVSKPNKHEQGNGYFENDVVTEVTEFYETADFLTPFDQHLTQAKVHYVDALIAQDENEIGR